MTSWNNRIMRHVVELNGGEFVQYFQMHEVFYKKNGKAKNWTVDAIAPYGDTVDGLIEHLEQLLNDAKRSKDDVLDYERKEKE